MNADEDALKRELVDISRRCGSQGWCPGTLGNVSFINPETRRIYIKRSGADLNTLSIEDVITLDLSGKALDGEGRPSMEASFHCGIYKVRKEVKAVFHVHPPFATAYAVAGVKLPLVTEAARIVLVEVPLLPSSPPGSIELTATVNDGFKDSRIKAVLLREHGIVTVGENLENGYHMASLVEDTAKIAFLSSLIKK